MWQLRILTFPSPIFKISYCFLHAEWLFLCHPHLPLYLSLSLHPSLTLCAFVCLCVCMSNGEIRHLYHLFSVLIFESGYFTKPGAHWLGKVQWPEDSRNLPIWFPISTPILCLLRLNLLCLRFYLDFGTQSQSSEVSHQTSPTAAFIFLFPSVP